MSPHARDHMLDSAAATRSRGDVRRVAHFTDTYLPRRDGVVSSLDTLRAALEADGCQGLVVAPHHPDRPHRPGLTTVGSVPSGVANLRLGAWPTARHVRRIAAWRPDLVHVHTPGPVGLLGVLTARRLGLPLVHTYHTDLHAYADAYRVPASALAVGLALYARRLSMSSPAGHTTGRSRRHAMIDAANQLLLGDADAVIVPTPAVLARAHLPVPPQRVFLVPAGVPQPQTSSDAVAAFAGRHGIAADDKVVLFVGRVNREKGIELLLPAFATVVAAVPAARLVLVGAVYEPRWLSRLVETHRLAGRIVLTGQLPPDQVAAAYANADVLAFPSRTDTQGLVLQEAAIAGLPSVLADPALHRTGVLGAAAVLADANPSAYAEALTRLLTDPVAARRAGALARQRALAYTPARYAATTREVYGLAAIRRSSASAVPGADAARPPVRRRRRLVRHAAAFRPTRGR